MLTTACVALTALLGVLLGLGVRAQRDGLRVIGGQAAPVVVAAAHLYFALGDMDAQVANVLLVGDAGNLGFTRAQALSIFEQRRGQVDRDLQAVAAAGGDSVVQQELRQVFDLLGSYEALAAQTLLLQQQAHSPAGHPPVPALDTYRQAADLLRTRLLPAAHVLIDREARALDRTYRARRSAAVGSAAWVGVVGGVLLVILFVFQAYLARRFHRLLSPALAAATVILVVLTAGGVATMAAQAEHLRVAKQDAFDSIVALMQARAVSYDANADESRYLLDPQRAAQYQDAFAAKTRQLVELPDATLSTFDAAFAAAIRGYQTDHADVGWGGYFGTEFRNITFVGERAAAEATLLHYQTYQADDRRIRQLATSGHLDKAIAFCTSYQPGQSNDAFTRYDNALAALIAINQHAFDRSVRDGQTGVSTGRIAGATAGLLLVVALTLAGVAGRLAEYR